MYRAGFYSFGMWKKLLCAGVVSFACVARGELPPAFTDLTLEQALKQVDGTEKPLIVKFTAAWCMPCKAMDKTTWSDPKVVDWVKAHGVAIEIDIDKQPKLAEQYQATAIPLMVMLRSGKEVGRQLGYMNSDKTIQWMENSLSGKAAEAPKAGGAGAPADPNSPMSGFQRARELVAAGKPDEATKEYIAVWELMGKDPAMAGARGTFLAHDMQTLASRHAPAREAFTKMRDEAWVRAQGAAPDVAAVGDWFVLNGVLEEDEKTLVWFDEHKSKSESRSVIDAQHWPLERVLVESERWSDIPLLYPNPEAPITEAFELSKKAAESDLRADLVDQAWDAYRERVAILYVGYLAAGKDDGAAALLAKARSLYDKPRLVTGAVNFAVRNGQARPVMTQLLDEAGKAGADVSAYRAQLDEALKDK